MNAQWLVHILLGLNKQIKRFGGTVAFACV